MESTESSPNPNPFKIKTNKFGGVGVCKDKSKTCRVKQSSFGTKKKYKTKGKPTPPEIIEKGVIPENQSHMNVRYL